MRTACAKDLWLEKDCMAGAESEAETRPGRAQITQGPIGHRKGFVLYSNSVEENGVM